MSPTGSPKGRYIDHPSQLHWGDRIEIRTDDGWFRFNVLWLGPSRHPSTAFGYLAVWHIVAVDPEPEISPFIEIHPRSYQEGRVFLIRRSVELPAGTQRGAERRPDPNHPGARLK